MKITRLQLRDFGRHRDLDIELAPGFTIIRGPNEAGKSTIQRGIELALFRKPTAATAELEALRSWGAAEDERSSTADRVRHGRRARGRTVTAPVAASWRRNSAVSAGASRWSSTAIPTRTRPRSKRSSPSLTGIPNEAFFRSTASIRHEELDDLDRDEGALRDRLQASIGGGDKGSSRARARLEDAIRALKSRGDKNPGRLKIAEEAVARAEVALKNGEAALEKLEDGSRRAGQGP